MTKIEELIESIKYNRQTDMFGYVFCPDFAGFQIKQIMKQYAEHYAKNCLQDFFDDFTRYDEVEEELYFNCTFPENFLDDYNLPPVFL